MCACVIVSIIFVIIFSVLLLLCGEIKLHNNHFLYASEETFIRNSVTPVYSVTQRGTSQHTYNNDNDVRYI